MKFLLKSKNFLISNVLKSKNYCTGGQKRENDFLTISFLVPVTTNNPQIREQMSGPDLNAFTLKFLALKEVVFTFQKKNYEKGIMQLFSADAVVFSKDFLKYF